PEPMAVEPAPAIETAPAVEPMVEPITMAAGAPVMVTREESNGIARFTFSSSEPLAAQVSTAKFPNRILITFQSRPIDFGGLALGKTRYFKGAVASSLRLTPGANDAGTTVQIALDRPIDEVSYRFDSDGGNGVLEIAALNPAPVVAPEPAVEPVAEPEPVVMPEPVAEPAVESTPEPVAVSEPAPVSSSRHLEIPTQSEEPTPAPESDPVAEPAPVVESEPVAEPVMQPAVEPVIEPEPIAEPEPVAIEEPAPVAIEEPAPAIDPAPEPEPIPAVEPGLKPIEETIMSFNFKDADFSDVLELMAKQALFNYVIEDSVPDDQGLTVFVQESKIFGILESFKHATGVQYRKKNGVYHFFLPPAPVVVPEPEPVFVPEPVMVPEPEPISEPEPVAIEAPAASDAPVIGDTALTPDEQAAEEARIAAMAEPVTEPAPAMETPAEEPAPVAIEEPAPVIETPAEEPAPAIEEPVIPEPEPIAPVQVEQPEPRVPIHDNTPEPAIRQATSTTAEVTGITYRTDGNNDIFEISYTGDLHQPVVTWLNYPSQLALSLPDASLESSIPQTTQPATGARFDASKLWTGGGGNSNPAVRVSLYLKPGTTSNGLNYKLGQQPGLLTVTVSGTALADTAPASNPQPAQGSNYQPPARVNINDHPADGATPAGTVETAPADNAPGVGAVPSTGPTMAPPVHGRYFANVDMGAAGNLPVKEEPLVTLDLKEAQVSDVLSIIGQEHNIDMVIDAGVKKAVTIKMTDRPLTQVFDFLAAQAGIKWFIHEGVYIFAPENAIKLNYGLEYGDILVYEPRFASAQQLQQVLRQLKLVDSADIQILRSKSGGGTGGSSNADTASEKLILRLSPRVKAQVITLLDQLDAPPVQIRLDVKILQVSQSQARKSGIDWLITNSGSNANNPGSVGFSLQEKTPGVLSFDPVTGAPIPQIGRPDSDFLGGFQRDPNNLLQVQAVINYLETSGDAVVVSNPNLVITSGSSGNLFVGEQIPFRSTFQVSDFGRVTQRVSTQNVGLTLQYAAKADITNGLVSLRVSPNLSGLAELTDIGPRTTQSNFTTQIVIPSGESFVVAGLVNDSDRNTNNKIPFLGDLPLLGQFFRSKNKTADRSELILIFTPIILDAFGNPLLFEDFQRNKHAAEAQQ
ncbi:MAG: hypothetical protein ABI743_04310, partial [bacterium]